MLIIKLVAAALIIVGTVVLLLRVHREIRGEGILDPLRKEKGNGRGKGKNNDASANELEAFITAYRRDKDAVAAASAPALKALTARKSFLTPHTKLCYLVLKTALPDHHVFCNTRLMDALELQANHPLGNVRIDIVVCNKDLGPIAAIDISNPDERNTPADREKSERLQGAGMRYLRFTPSGIPKPTEIRDLIYRM